MAIFIISAVPEQQFVSAVPIVVAGVDQLDVLSLMENAT
jgi:hypothetical protein